MSDQSGSGEAAHMPDSPMASWLISTYKTSEPGMRMFCGRHRPICKRYTEYCPGPDEADTARESRSRLMACFRNSSMQSTRTDG